MPKKFKMISSHELFRKQILAAIDRRLGELRINIRETDDRDLRSACRFAVRELRALRVEVKNGLQ